MWSTSYCAKTQPISKQLGGNTEEAHRASRGFRSNRLLVIRRRRVDEPVADPLVIALAVIVLDVLADHPANVGLPDRNDLRQALRPDGSNESLGIRVQIWAAAREPNALVNSGSRS